MYAVNFRRVNENGENFDSVDYVDSLNKAKESAHNYMRYIQSLGYQLVFSYVNSRNTLKATSWHFTDGYDTYYIYIMKLVDPK